MLEPQIPFAVSTDGVSNETLQQIGVRQNLQCRISDTEVKLGFGGGGWQGDNNPSLTDISA